MEREIYYSSDKTKIIVISPIDNEMSEVTDYLNRMSNPYNNLLVIGNGFDLNLGLKTTYRDFVNSYIFKRAYVRRMQEKCKNGNPQSSLIDYLYGKKFYDKWYDIEAALLEYVSVKPDGNFVNNANEDKKDYELVCESLIEYLSSLFKTGNDLEQAQRMERTPAGRLLQNLNSDRSMIYSFNYTPLNLIINAVFGPAFSNSVRVHGEIMEETIFKGNIKENSIVLGIETNDFNCIAPNYSFLLKSNNPIYKSSNISLDLLNSKNVIFFGHSLNQMDFGYFEGYFKMLTSNIDKEKSITIITKDELSRITILDNIRKMGFSVRDIFAHTNVQFILTNELSDNVKELEKFENLIKSL